MRRINTEILVEDSQGLSATPTRTGIRADAAREPARVGGPTDEASTTGDDLGLSANRDGHGTESAHEQTRPPYRLDAGPGGATAGGKVKLPKITLPHFKGNPIYWTAFWDSYESAVHLNDALSDVDKFKYLGSLLEKSAYEAIAGLTLHRPITWKQSIS